MNASTRNQTLLFLFLLLTAATLRFYRLEAIPPGLSTDEAQEGTDAIDVIEGHPRLYFPAGGGREPMLVYLDALAIELFGPTLLAVHLPVAVAGLMGVFAASLVAREMFGGRTAVFTAALVAVSYWELHNSRTGFRAILLIPFECLAFYFFWRGWNKTRTTAGAIRSARLDLVLAGSLVGATLYTYTAARVVPIVVVLFLAIMLFAARDRLADWRPLALGGLAAGIVFAPLGSFFLLNPAAFAERLLQVSSNDLAIPALFATFSRNIFPTLGMFTFAGDIQWHSNLPGRPVFDWLGSGFFYAGIVIAWLRVRKPEYVLLILWFIVGLLPGAISDESPHFLRTMVSLPPTYIFAALAMGEGYEIISTRWSGRVAQIAFTSILLYFGLTTTRDYFGVFANEREMYHYFYGDLAAAAGLLKQHPNERAFLSVEYSDLNETVMRYYKWNQPFADLSLFSATSGFVLTPRPALYVIPFTAPADKFTERWLGGATLLKQAYAENGLELYRAFGLSADRISPKVSLEANLGNAVQLIGYDAQGEPQAGGTLDVALYARTLENSKLDPGYKFFAHLVDASGYEWANDEAIASEVASWRSDETTATTFHLSIPADAPPKDNVIEFGLYSPKHGRVAVLDAQARVLGTTVAGKPTRVVRGPLANEAQLAISHRVQNVTLGELQVLGYDTEEARAGSPVRFILYWRARTRPARDYSYTLALVDAGGQAVAQTKFDPAGGAYPTSQWRAGEILRDSVIVELPAELEAGDYTLTLGNGDMTVPMTTVIVDAPQHRFTLPPIQNRREARLGDTIEFLGYDVEANARAGETFVLTLYWRALSTMQSNLTVFTHLIDHENKIWGQRDRVPVNGNRPTTSWVAKEIVIDRYRIPIVPDTPPGIYDIEIGMYDSGTLQRYPIFDESGNHLPDDRLVIGNLQVK